MTDKEIIIDGVNVAGCGFYHPEYNNNACHIALAFSDQYGECWKCEQNPNCNYKECKRKEQECEELKEWKNEVVRLWNRTCKCELLDEKNAICKETLKECIGIVSCRDRYKQALKKIEELVLITSQMEHSCAAETILEIINEVKND